MSFQITILKVLAGHPEGRASLADLTRYVAVLTSSGADWSRRMKCLAARAPGLDIFSSNFVRRDENGWQVTDAGRAFLHSIETSTAPAIDPVVASPVAVVSHDRPENVVQLADHAMRRRRRAAA